MENNENTAEKTATTQNVEKNETNSEGKTFTQEEVNEIVAKEKARAKKNSLSNEELEEFRQYQESKKTESERQAEKEKEQVKTKTENARLKQENILLKKGVTNEDDIDYIIYKISKMEGNFNDNVAEYLEKNPRYTERETKATGVISKGNTVEKDSGVRAILKSKHPDLF